jgi:hypothetical protein
MQLDSFPVERIMKCMRKLVSDPDTSTRAGALRVIRYAICSSNGVKQFAETVSMVTPDQLLLYPRH